MATKEQRSTRRISPQEARARRVIGSLYDPHEAGEIMQRRVLAAIKRNFASPIQSRSGNLRFELVGDLYTDGLKDPYDYAAIAQALGKEGSRGTYGSKIKGRFRVVEVGPKGTEKVLDETDVTLGQLPTPIFDRSYVVGGRKRFLPVAQFRRKPGVYTYTNSRDEVLTSFNVDRFTSSRVPNFAIRLGSKDGKPTLNLSMGSRVTSINAWDIAKALGAKDVDLVKAVGSEAAREIIETSTPESFEKSVKSFYDIIRPKSSPITKAEVTMEEATNLLREEFAKTRVDPAVTKATLGKPTEFVGSQAFVGGIANAIKVASKEREEDNPDALSYKIAMSPFDIMAEAVGHEKEVRGTQRSIESQLTRLERVRHTNPDTPIRVKRLLGSDINKKLQARLTSSQLQRGDSGTNPMDGWAQSTITTLMGEGGIGSTHALTETAKALDGSQLGFIDPNHTPESAYAGVNVHITGNTRLRYTEGSETAHTPGSSELVTRLMDNKGRTVELSPSEKRGKIVGSFDQFIVEDGKVKAKGPTITAFKNGEPIEVKASEVDYWLPSSMSMMDIHTNLIPFGNSTHGNRAQYSAKQMAQTLPLVDPDAPLIQIQAPGEDTSLESVLSTEAGAKYSPVAGTVKKVVEGKSPYEMRVLISPKDGGEDVVVNLPKNFPMAGGTSLDSVLRVKAGDEIEEGGLLADSSFTKDGALALGKNLRVAYMPWYTDTFEDALVISERAAKKMTSRHMYTEGTESDRLTAGLKAYSRAGGAPIPKEAREFLDEDGVIKPGSVVKPGQVLQLGANEVDLRREEDRTLQELKLLKGESTSGRALTPFAKTWNSEYEGTVLDVQKRYNAEGKVIGAEYKITTQEPMRAGDKIFGRHGNKGVVSRVIPDDEMPRVDGKVDVINPGNSGLRPGTTISQEEADRLLAEDPTMEVQPAILDMILNPLGIPSRINPSQNLETFLAKIAHQNGKPELVKTFGYDSNYQYVKDRLEEAGVSDTDTIVDPTTGRKIQNVGVGYQYIAKAKQTATDKTSARGLGRFNADTGAAIKGEDGAQLAGELGTYGLLSNNAREVIRDMQLNKTEYRQDVIKALAEGTTIPMPKDTPDAYRRFTNYLIAAGARPTEIGRGKFQLQPMTDDDIIKMASLPGPNGERQDLVIEKPYETIRSKHQDFQKAAIQGGLFSEDVAGGANANRWTRFELSSAIPNPAYERSILDLTGLRKKDFREILEGKQSLEIPTGEGEEGEVKRVSGSEAIQTLLQGVNLQERFAELKEEAINTKDARERSKAYRGMRMIETLQKMGITPEQAFMKKQVAVLPLNMRGLRRNTSGAIVVDDINYLYRDLGLTNQGLEEAKKANLPPKAIGQIEAGLYDGMAALLETEGSKPVAGEYQGVFGTLSGIQWRNGVEAGDPKKSFFRDKVLNRRQAFTARAVLAPDDSLDMDEVGLPRNVAASLFEQEILRLNNKGGDRSRGSKQSFSEELQGYIKEGKESARVEELLAQAMRGKYVVVKRDPVLHQYGVQGFKPVLLPPEKKSMSLNPLVYSGLGADNDGDTLAISLPLSKEAQDEVRDKLLPSQNLFAHSSGQLAFTLSQEAVSGITRLTRNPVEVTDKEFKNLSEAQEAWRNNEIDAHTGIKIGGRTTTMGRQIFENTIKTAVPMSELVEKGVLDGFPKHGLGKRDINKVLTYVARNKPDTFSKVADDLRREGQRYASYSSLSVTMDDLRPALVEERKAATEFLKKTISEISQDRSLTNQERDTKIKAAYAEVMGDLESKAKSEWLSTLDTARPNSMAEMVNSGARGNMGQLSQALLAPIAVLDSKDRILKNPVMRSYVEGLSPGGYWSASYGARKGAVNKVVQVQQPGALSKEIINTSIDTVVTEEDCGTKEGVEIEIGGSDSDRQLLGRTLATGLDVGDNSYKAGRALSHDDLRAIDGSIKGKGTVKVRSALTCKAKEGVCKKCAGAGASGAYPEIGSNIGIQAAQSLGERSTQLMLSSFHSGGRFDPKDTTAGDLFDKAQAVLRMPEEMSGHRAYLAQDDDTVAKVYRDKLTRQTIMQMNSGKTYQLPSRRTGPDGKTPLASFYKPGDKVKRGQILTDGIAHPEEMYRLTGDIGKTRQYMVNELDKVFGPHGISRKNSEVVVRAMTNKVEVTNPGKSKYLPGQRITEAAAWDASKNAPDLEFTPVLKGVNVAPRELREDYMSQLNFTHLRKSLSESFAKAATTDVHSTNPIPGMGYGKEFNRPTPTNPSGAY